MPSRDPVQRFEDIVANIDRIEVHIARIDGAGLGDDPTVYDAVERCLERISEAASKLGSEAEMLCPGVAWGQIRGLGNVLRHEYDRVDSIRIW